MKIAKSFMDLIGHTPLLELARYNQAQGLSWSILTRPAVLKTGWRRLCWRKLKQRANCRPMR